ncbi:MAG: Lrp/AsnC family transcriptional regulator, partial [Candidatus Odinarchaeota archaeon]|nr:Lrp/AsnC family transcriptional regulator [Candidatus Odinarchaeota archaeon]
LKAPEKEYSLSDIKLIQELARDPLASLDTLSQKTGLSKSWIINRKKDLLDEKAVIVKNIIDMRYFGLRYKSLVFMVKKENEELFLNLIKYIPYVTRMLKIYDYYRVNPTFIYIITVFLPHNADAIFTKWISSFLRYQVVDDFYSLEFHSMGHCLNLEMFDTRDWIFDVNKAGLYSFYFLKEYREIIPITENLRLFKFQEKIRTKFDYVELYVAAMLNYNPYFTLREIQQSLAEHNIDISMGSLHKIKRRIMKHMFPVMYLSKSGLNTSFTIYIWQPNISREEIDFLIKYFANHYPQSYIFVSNDGFYATIEVPTRETETIKETLTILQDVYYDVILFDKAYTRGSRAFGNLIHYWDTRKKRWIVEDWMFPEVSSIVRKIMD